MAVFRHVSLMNLWGAVTFVWEEATFHLKYSYASTVSRAGLDQGHGTLVTLRENDNAPSRAIPPSRVPICANCSWYLAVM